MTRRTTLVLAFLALAAADALAQYKYGYQQGGRSQQAQAPAHLGARYRYWLAEIDGDFAADDDNIDGNSVGVDSSLNIGGEHISEITLWLPNLPFVGQLNLQYWWQDFNGSGFLNNDVTFAGGHFEAGDPVDADLDFRVWSFLWEYSQQGPGLGRVASSSAWTMQVGFKWLTVDAKISGEDDSRDATVQAWIPVFGLQGQLGFGQNFGVGIEVNGAQAIGVSGVDGLMYDLAVFADVRIKNFFLGAGYRWFRVDIADDSPRDADEMDLDLEIVGWFFEGGLRF